MLNTLYEQSYIKSSFNLVFYGSKKITINNNSINFNPCNY